MDALTTTAAGATATTDLAIPYPAEDQPAVPQASVLPGLAAATGGRLLDAAHPGSETPGDGTGLWPLLAALAAALVLAGAVADTRRA